MYMNNKDCIWRHCLVSFLTPGTQASHLLFTNLSIINLVFFQSTITKCMQLLPAHQVIAVNQCNLRPPNYTCQQHFFFFLLLRGCWFLTCINPKPTPAVPFLLELFMTRTQWNQAGRSCKTAFQGWLFGVLLAGACPKSSKLSKCAEYNKPLCIKFIDYKKVFVQ